MKHDLFQVRLDLLILLWLRFVQFAEWMTLHVRVNDESGKLIVNIFLYFITDDGQYIETRENRVCEVDVVIKVKLWLVNTSDRISRSND